MSKSTETLKLISITGQMKEPLLILLLLFFAGSLFGQEMTPEQKQIIEKIDQENKLEKQKQDEIEKKLGITKSKTANNKQKEDTDKFFWKDGIGLTTESVNQGRNLSQYISGGHIDCRKWGSKDDLSLACSDTKVRDFVWQCWTEKKRGYITKSVDTVDAQTTSHIFIEPNNKGQWQVVEMTVRFQAISPQHPYFVDFTYFKSIFRVDKQNNKNDWKLVLKDTTGKDIREIPFGN